MVDFELVKSEYPGVPGMILSVVDGFRDSQEYGRLNDIERSLPGIVAASFSSFMVRLQNAAIHERLTDRERTLLARSYETLE